MSSIVITAAKRTPVGSFLGAYAATPAHELGRIAIEAALAQSGLSPDEDGGETSRGSVSFLRACALRFTESAGRGF